MATTAQDEAARSQAPAEASEPAHVQPSDKLPSLWERTSFACMRGLLRAHTAVWGWRNLYRSARFFATLEYLTNYKRRRRVGQMIDVVFGGTLSREDRNHWIREHFRRQRCDKVFYLVFDYLPTERVRECYSIVNRELIDSAIARGRGVYVMLSHFGPQHVAGMTMSALGYRVGGVRDPNEGAMRRYIQRLWDEKHPDLPRAKVLYSGNFARDIYRLFKENYALGSSLDVTRQRDATSRTVAVQVYGETRDFLTGTLQIALRCGAAVLQGFIVGEEDFRYRLELMGPMCDPDNAKESPELIAEVMQKYAENLEMYARRHPDHVMRA